MDTILCILVCLVVLNKLVSKERHQFSSMALAPYMNQGHRFHLENVLFRTNLAFVDMIIGVYRFL